MNCGRMLVASSGVKWSAWFAGGQSRAPTRRSRSVSFAANGADADILKSSPLRGWVVCGRCVAVAGHVERTREQPSESGIMNNLLSRPSTIRARQRRTRNKQLGSQFYTLLGDICIKYWHCEPAEVLRGWREPQASDQSREKAKWNRSHSRQVAHVCDICVVCFCENTSSQKA